LSEFNSLMHKVDRTYRKIADEDPYVAQLMVPFAFKFRRLYSWQFGQDLFCGTAQVKGGRDNLLQESRMGHRKRGQGENA